MRISCDHSITLNSNHQPIFHHPVNPHHSSPRPHHHHRPPYPHHSRLFLGRESPASSLAQASSAARFDTTEGATLSWDRRADVRPTDTATPLAPFPPPFPSPKPLRWISTLAAAPDARPRGRPGAPGMSTLVTARFAAAPAIVP